MACIYSAPAENYESLIHPIPRNEAVTKRISFVQNENFYKNCIKIHWRSDCNEEWLSGNHKKEMLFRREGNWKGNFKVTAL